MDPSVMSHVNQTLQPKIESSSQASSSPGDFSFQIPRDPRLDGLMHNGPSDPYSAVGSDFTSPFSHDYNLPHFDSPIENKMNGSLGDMATMNGMIMPVHGNTVGSINTGFHHRHDSMGASEPWSPTSSREQAHGSDENLPNQGEDNKKNNGTKQEPQDDDKPPAWSELKTKAGKERKRLPLACIACRRKKIRCSGEKPACKHCLRSRIPCVYKVTTRKAAPRTDYMAMLDKRLKRMEERVIKVIPKEELPDIGSLGRAVVRPALPTQAPKAHRPSISKKRSADEAFVAELNEWTKSKGQTSIPESVLRRQQMKPGEENTLLTEGADFLPPIDLQEHLAEVFFDCIYGQSYLLLHKPSFMRKLKAGSVPPVLILAVCAIAARFSTHPEVNTEPAFLRGDSWATPARAIVERRHYEPNITILTVMLILGLHYFGTCEGGLSWSFGGQALRMAYALQLHKELDHDPLGRKNGKVSELSFTDREIRRRTMWACFLMDRFNSSGTERPHFGNEEFVHIQLPVKESRFQMEIPGPTEDLDGSVPNPMSPGNGQVSDPKSNMGVAAYVIRAVVLWGRIVKYLNLGGKEKDKYPFWAPESGFAALQRQIQNFNSSLPALLAYSKENLQNHSAERVANQFIYLHIICQQNILFLNRFAIPVSPGARPPRDMPKDFLNDCGKRVIASAEQISKMIDAAAGHLLTVPFAGYCAYAASTVHVWGIFSKQPQLEASSKENLRHNYKYLNKMKKYWGMFHYMAESVKEIYRAFADAALRGASSAGAGNHHPMFQYGDWFDKYPHGVSRTDWEGTDREAKKEPGTEAVMSHQSELQSVEEFFASLSPPSKADLPRKAQRRKGTTAGESGRSKKQSNKNETNSNNQPPASSQPVQESTSLPNNQDFSAISMPEQQLFQHTEPFSSQPQQADFNFQSFFPTNQLGQLDRQLVFGAYAGIDSSSSNHSNLNNLNNGGFSQNFWEGVDLNGMNPSTAANGFMNGGDGSGASSNEASSAWFMPFNMDPPEIGNENLGGLFGEAGMGMGFGGGSSFSNQGGQHPTPQTTTAVPVVRDIDMGIGEGHGST